MKNIVLLLALILSIASAACSHTNPETDISELTEASMNFDQEAVGEFLQIVSKEFDSGFSSKDVEKLTRKIDTLAIDEEDSWEYKVAFNGKSTRFVVSAYKDDIDAPDLAFYTNPTLALKIQKLLESFATKKGW
jgi:hypothetical protein